MSDLWKNYLESKAFVIDLSEVGLDGYWVKVLPSSAMPPSKFRKLLGNQDTFEVQTISMREWVLDWNLPDGDGKPLPIPRKSDAWMDVLPTSVIVHIIQKIAEHDRQVTQGNVMRTPASSPPFEATGEGQIG